MPSSTGQFVAWHARHAPETTAIVTDGARVTYRGLAADIARFVLVLKRLGIEPGQLVGLRSEDRYQHLLLLLACEALGVTSTTVTPEDVALDDPIVRACDRILADDIPAAANIIAIPANLRDHVVGAKVEPASAMLLEREIAPDRIARVVRTSGTTGRAKAMPMTHATQQLRVVRTIGRVAREILPNPRLLCLYGLAVGSVYTRVLGVLQNGGTVHFATGDDVDRLLAEGAINYASFTLGDIEQTVRRAASWRLTHKLHLEVFGATVGPELRRRIRERLNAGITNKYSSNETNPIAVIGDDNVGILEPGVAVRIVDASGRDVPAGEPGRIRVRTETMVHGYFNDPALTAACFIDGWFQTSDRGVMPEPGRLVLLGRADDMLNIGGVKIAPAPIEDQVKRLDGVRDVVVVSVVTEDDVGILVVFVEIEGDRLAEPLAIAVGEATANFATRFEIVPIPAFPRTATGKIKRHEMAGEYQRSPAANRIRVG